MISHQCGSVLLKTILWNLRNFSVCRVLWLMRNIRVHCESWYARQGDSAELRYIQQSSVVHRKDIETPLLLAPVNVNLYLVTCDWREWLWEIELLICSSQFSEIKYVALLLNYIFGSLLCFFKKRKQEFLCLFGQWLNQCKEMIRNIFLSLRHSQEIWKSTVWNWLFCGCFCDDFGALTFIESWPRWTFPNV